MSVDFKILRMSRCCNSRSSTSLACSNATCVLSGSLGSGVGMPSDEEDEDDERLVGEQAGEGGLLERDRDRGRGGGL